MWSLLCILGHKWKATVRLVPPQGAVVWWACDRCWAQRTIGTPNRELACSQLWTAMASTFWVDVDRHMEVTDRWRTLCVNAVRASELVAASKVRTRLQSDEQA